MQNKQTNKQTNCSVKSRTKASNSYFGIVIMLIFISLQSCEEKLDVLTETDNNQSVITKLTLSQILSEINNPEIQSKLGEVNEKLIKNNPFGRFAVSDTLFTKYEDINIPTTYFVTLNSYSEVEPYFLKLIITIEENEPKLCFIKYIPANPTDTLELINYSGEIQVLDIDENIKARTFFINGIPFTNTQDSKTSRMETVCHDEVSIREIFCSHSGKHGVGDSCSPPLINDAHFVMKITTLCQTTYRLPARIYENSIFPTTRGGGGGDSNQTLLNSFVNTLEPTEKNIYYSDPEIQNYLLSNIIQQPLLNNNPALQPINNTTPPKIIDPKAIQFVKLVLQNSEIGAEVDFLYKVIIDKSFKDNPCLMGVYEQLGEAKTFQNYLQNFDGDFSVAHLKLSADTQFANTQDPEYWDAMAVTESPQNYLIGIVFNTDSSLTSNIGNYPKMVTALVFIHEMIHAEIYRKLLMCSNLPNVNYTSMTDSQWKNHLNNMQNNFPGLYDYFVRYQLNTLNPSPFQHQQMAQHYREIIKNVLKQYDNNQHNEDFYNAISWIGLKDTVAWNNLTQNEKNQINLIIQNSYQNEKYCD